jgi:hypothetical protein
MFEGSVLYDILGTPDAKDKMARQEMLFSRMLNDETLNEGTLCHKKSYSAFKEFEKKREHG